MPKNAIPPQDQKRTFTWEGPWVPYALADGTSRDMYVNDPTHPCRNVAVYAARAAAGSQPAGLDFWIGTTDGEGPYSQAVCYRARVYRQLFWDLTNTTQQPVNQSCQVIKWCASNINNLDLSKPANVILQYTGTEERLMFDPSENNHVSWSSTYDFRNWSGFSSIREMVQEKVLSNTHGTEYTCAFTAAASPTYVVKDSYVLFDPTTNAQFALTPPVFCKTRIEFDCFLTRLVDKKFIDA